MEEPVKPEKRLTPQAEQVLSHCLTMLSFEGRTPLMAIIGYSEVILKAEDQLGPLTEKQRRGLTSIHKSAKAVLELWELLFDVHRIVYDHLVLNIETIDLSELIQQVVSKVQAKVEQRLPDRLPKVLADDRYIQQTLSRLFQIVSDAIRFEGEGKIIITLNYDDNFLTVNINGIGENRLYFFENDPGFFISRSIIEMHGGQMQVNLHEELNQLEISFTLPIEQNKPVNQEIV